MCINKKVTKFLNHDKDLVHNIWVKYMIGLNNQVGLQYIKFNHEWSN